MRSEKPEVTIGIHSALGSVDHGGGTTTLEVAIWNEFGTTRIPERSFLRAWFDEHKDEARVLWTKLMRSVAMGTRSQEDAVNLFGLHCVGQIQDRISQSIPPPNADSTVKRKGSSTTLIDTGVLRSSITHSVQ
jgi:hypothetical protein